MWLFPEVSTPLETVVASSALARVMHSQGFEDSLLVSTAKGTCHDPFSDSCNTVLDFVQGLNSEIVFIFLNEFWI